MTLLQQLEGNKGTLSSALGKSLAEKVLKGEKEILKESVQLLRHENKNVRAGAAKIIEMVAEKKPELLAYYLDDFMPALDAPEPQTRWMIIRSYGLCAKLNPKVAEKALNKARSFLKDDSGACLWNRTISYLGNLGAVSEKHAQEIFPILEDAFTAVPKQENTILEAIEKMIPIMDSQTKGKVVQFADKYSNDKQTNIKSKVLKIQKKLKK